jgi:two-component system phosphate regulon sensor histidine kinase PhoR
LKLGIRSKLFALSIGLILVSILVFYAYTRARLERAITESIGDDLTVRANLVAMRVSTSGAKAGDFARFDELADSLGASAGARVTLIDHEGVVLGDSEVGSKELPSLENHRQRPEVQEAIQGRVGQIRRYSSTVEHYMLYVAVPTAR